MSKTTKTEKLIDKLIGILDAGDLMLNPPEDMVEFIDKGAIKLCRLDQLLKACKEAGMEFVDRGAELPHETIRWEQIALMQESYREVAQRFHRYGQQEMIDNSWHKTEEMEID